MDSTATTIILGLAAAWLIQYVLTFWQMRRFYKRIAQLRRYGTVSVGMAGSSWRRKQYGVLAVDANRKITHVEQLSGWTVLATLKPVEGLDGLALNDLMDEDLELPISPKLRLALQNAASYIQNKDAAPARTIDAASPPSTPLRSAPDEENSASAAVAL